jgi:hypothetical protein
MPSTAVTLDLHPRRRVEFPEQLPPACISQTRGDLRRADDVGEEHRPQRPLASGIRANPEVAPAERIDRHEWFVALDPRIVSGRNFEGIVGLQQDRRAIVHHDPEPARDDEPDVVDLARDGPDNWAKVDRPPPARLIGDATDGHVPELDELEPAPTQGSELIRLAKVPALEAGHRVWSLSCSGSLHVRTRPTDGTFGLARGHIIGSAAGCRGDPARTRCESS